MLKTTKEVGIDLHSGKTSILSFDYSYERNKQGFIVRVTPYAEQSAADINGDPMIMNLPVRGAETVRRLSEEEINGILQEIKDITPVNDNPLVYMDSLVENGIKYIIVNEGLWKGQLTMDDFE